MATTYYTDIQKLYVAYFNRPADDAGLKYYEGVLEAATNKAATLAVISADFAKSTEYTAAFNGKTSAQIVDIIYTNIFGHAADAAGNKFYADNLDAKKVTLADIVTEVAKGAQGTDLNAYNAKLSAAAAFSAAVDTDAEKTGYSGDAANKVAKTFLAGVTDAVSLAAATTPGALNGTVATAVAAGTPFSVTGALAQVSSATKAYNAFVKGIDVDGDPDTATLPADIGTAKTDAVATVAADLSGGVTGPSGVLFTATTTSSTVRDALIAAQQATNAANLNTAQATVVADTAKIAAVAGLADTATAMTSAANVLKSAKAAEVTARADIAGKEAAFGINNPSTTGTASSAVTKVGTTLVYTKAGDVNATVLANIDATTGKATIDENANTKLVGLTELIASYNTEVNALTNIDKAQANANNAQLSVNLLDVAPDTVKDANGNDVANTVTTIGTTAYTEKALIKAIADQINATTKDSVATGAAPTLAQIQTELAVLKAQSDQTAYNSFKVLVDAETGAAASFNPLIAKQTADTKAVTDITKAITTLNKDVAALQSANANVDTLAGLKATVDAYNKVLTDKGYAVTTLDAAHTTTTLFGTAASDVYITSNKDASIAAFGLQGSDQLFVGTGYTLVQGSATGADAVKGNDAAMEIFVSNVGGDTVLQIETHAYSSAVTGTGTGEIVTITLTGVDATTIKLDSTGIITAPHA